ncbi:MAG: hypothetical protein V1837_05925 [Candidatus Woesearchaeota archaeon]
MRTIALWIALLLILTPLCMAIDIPPLASVMEGYNSNIDNVPGFVKSIIGTERINCHISLDDGSTLNVMATSSKGKLESLDFGELENATMIVKTSEATISKITSADNPITELKKALSDKEITYEPQGFMKKVKWGFVSFALKFSVWFGFKRK